MKKLILAALCAASAACACAQLTVSGGMMRAAADLDMRALRLKSTGAARLTPAIITAAGDTIGLRPVSVYGRRAVIDNNRAGRSVAPGSFRANAVPATLAYADSVKFSPALNGARLVLRTDIYGCANCLKSTSWTDLGDPWYLPEIDPRDFIVYEVPEATAVKETSLEGKAYVQFRVNRTELLPDFRNNAAELAKIRSVIDSVKSDSDMTVTSIAIKGFASPEGSYANNERLARGRTEALKSYVEKQYSFPRGFISTSWEPEDWDGLRAAVEADASLPQREQVLAIIGYTSLSPDARDAKLRADCPEAYRILLDNVYPTLRHSDYRVAYTIRHFTTPAEALAVFKSNPAKLSLDEFYLAAQALEPGSDEFRNLWETAARLHPSSSVARVNATMATLAAGDADSAALHIAGTTDNAAENYARALVAIARKRWADAETLLRAAGSYGRSAELLPRVEQMLKISN